MEADVPLPAVKSVAPRLAVTLFASVTSLSLYVPAVCVTVKLSLPTRLLRLKFAGVSDAAVVPSYTLVGSPMIAAVTVLAVM